MTRAIVERRIAQLVDPGTFEELHLAPAAGYVVGTGRAHGRRIAVCATSTEAERWAPLDTLRQQLRLLEHVHADPCPLVLLGDAPGFDSTARGRSPVPPDADELQVGKDCVGRAYYLQARLQGLVPVVGVLYGKVAASLSFPLALCDALVMVEGSALCIGRPDAVRLMIGEDETYEGLGGARTRCEATGLGHALAASEEAAATWVRSYLACVPSRAGAPLPEQAATAPAPQATPLARLVPADCLRPFRMHRLIEAIVDAGSLVELKALHARHVITGLARVEGRVCGILANDPWHSGGILFPDGCRKLTGFIRCCDAFGIPLLFLADTPGFMVGRKAEEEGSVAAGAELFAAIARSTTRRLCVVVRKAYTAGLYAMGGAGFAPARLLALPTASIAIYGRKALELLAADGSVTDAGRRAVQEMLVGVEDPRRLQERGMIDRVIDWPDLRPEVARFLQGA
jgi:acetyl-CoA carboxylase carboxyltransferase component